MERNLKLSAVS